MTSAQSTAATIPSHRPSAAERAANAARAKSRISRRRHIDPTTCERDYSHDELEFMQALDAYKRSSGRTFPTCSEILEVIRGLGYTRVEVVDVEA